MAQEVEKILEHIRLGHNFLLSGGAGSGKTYTLVKVIREIISLHPSAMIACITYTNAGVREIERRVNHKNLRVSTIHDFLWSCIGSYQRELKTSLIHLINDGAIKVPSSITPPVDVSIFINDEKPQPIQYKEYLRIANGIISHDEVIKLADYMFNHYQKLREIIRGSYPFILIDEYQDTNPTIIRDLLTNFEGDSRKSIIGFFGDSMQSIYDEGIGDLSDYIAPQGNVYEVKIEQNRRSPQKVIDLANRIRLDSLRQKASEDDGAPNMIDGHIKNGKAIFIYSDYESTSIENVRKYLEDKEQWNFEDTSKTKELNLTHKLIAGKAGFGTLMDIYTGDGIMSFKDKVKKFVVQKGLETEGKSFGGVLAELELEYPDEKKSYAPTKMQAEFIKTNPSLYEKVKSCEYDVVAKMFVSPDQLVDDKKQEEDETSKTGSKRSALVKHLMNIERCIYMYQTGQVADFLKSTQFEIHSIDDKRRLHESIELLVNVGDATIGEIIDRADECKIVVKDDALNNYAERNPYIYERVMAVPYKEVQCLFFYLEGMTPFSTQHKTKGTEYDNVFVILDNGRWNNYNFEKMFTAEGDDLSNTVVRRTRKIFYVCCTRAKENLAVYYHLPSQQVLVKAKEWFGDNCVVKIDNIK